MNRLAQTSEPVQAALDDYFDPNARSVLHRGAAVAFAVQVCGAGVGLVMHVVLARLMGVSGYGVFCLALTWISILSLVALLGQWTAVVRFVAQYVRSGQWSELRGLRSRVTSIVAAFSVFVSLIGGGIVYFLSDRIGRVLTVTLYAGFIVLPILAQLHLQGALHRGLKRAASLSAFDLLRKILLLGLVLAVGMGTARTVNPEIAMAANGLAALVALVCSFLLLFRAWPRRSAQAVPRYETRVWISVGGALFFQTIVTLVLNRVDVLVLGALGSAEQVAPYFASVQMAAVALYGMKAVNTILAPMIAERYAVGDQVGIKRIARRAARLMFAVTLTMAVAIAFFGRWILAQFGPGFEVAYSSLLIVLAGQCVNAAVGPAGYLMTMTHFERQASWAFGVAAAINIAMSVMLVPGVGMVGAAWATALSTMAWSGIAFGIVRCKLHVNSSIF